MRIYKKNDFLHYYMNTVLPTVGADKLPAIIGDAKGPYAVNPILEIDDESNSICVVCDKTEDCMMYQLSKKIEEKGARITIDRCKSFKPRGDAF